MGFLGYGVIEKILELLSRRDKAVRSLLSSLEHLPREQQFAVLTSNLSVEELERLAEFQDRE
jgi:hypothetical protein